MSPSKRGTAFLLSLVVAGSAHAVDMNDCKALEDDAKRLACFDELSGRTLRPAERKMGEVAKDVRGDVSGIGALSRRAAAAPVPGTRPSSLAERWDLDRNPDPGLFSLRPYKPVYVLPASYSSRPTTDITSPNAANTAQLPGKIDHLETKFQFSIKTKVLQDIGFEGSNLWFGYTQSSRWQTYNRDESRPFRETNYEPELIYNAPVDFSLGSVRTRMAGLSLTHQSNGRAIPLSRGWNRVIGQVGLEAGEWTALVRPWLRIRENASRDDNSDILDYVGRGEVVAIRKIGNQQLAVTVRHTLRGGERSRGSVAVDYAFPIYGYLKGHLQLFHGYGESLIDYNRRQSAIGVGVSLEEWL